MALKKIKIGVIGIANIATRSVIPAILELNNYFELKAIASRDKIKLDNYSKLYNCQAYESYDDLINHAEIDAIYIPLPTGLHKEYISKALKKGLHVYAEKSISMNFSDTKTIIKHAKQSNLALMEGYMFQYHKQHSKVKQIISDGQIGEIRFFISKFGFPPLDSKNFRYDSKIGGGVLLDAAGYPLRSVHFLLGNDFEVVQSSLFIDPSLQTGLYGSAFLKNKDGVGASISFGFDNFYQCNYEIWGQKGKIFVLKSFTPGKDAKTKIILEKNNEKPKTIYISPDNHFKNAFKEFYECIHDNKKKQSHYDQISLQSKSLDLIQKFSNN